MEFWLTVSKLIVFLYIVFSYIYANIANLPWVIFTLLIYLSVNVMISIFKKIRIKILICMSIGVVMLFTWRVHPFLFCFTFELIRNYILLHRKELATLCRYDAPNYDCR